MLKQTKILTYMHKKAVASMPSYSQPSKGPKIVYYNIVRITNLCMFEIFLYRSESCKHKKLPFVISVFNFIGLASLISFKLVSHLITILLSSNKQKFREQV